MHNYAYRIGGIVKMGLDMNDAAGIKRFADLQKTAETSGLIMGQDAPTVIELWKRKARDHQEMHRVRMMLIRKFSDFTILNKNGEWVTASTEVITFFNNLRNSPDNGNKFWDDCFRLYYGQNDPQKK